MQGGTHILAGTTGQMFSGEPRRKSCLAGRGNEKVGVGVSVASGTARWMCPASSCNCGFESVGEVRVGNMDLGVLGV